MQTVKKLPKPSLKEGTRAKRIFDFLSITKQASYTEIYNVQVEYHTNTEGGYPLGLDQNVGLILGRMVYYGQIKKISRGIYSIN